jgi:hypothetical protein
MRLRNAMVTVSLRQKTRTCVTAGIRQTLGKKTRRNSRARKPMEGEIPTIGEGRKVLADGC